MNQKTQGAALSDADNKALFQAEMRAAGCPDHWTFEDDGTGGFHNHATEWAWIGWQRAADRRLTAEHVATVICEGVKGVTFTESCNYGCDLPIGTKLYRGATAQPQAEPAATLHLTVAELREAAEFVADDEPDTDVVLSRLPARMSTEQEPMEAGLYLWWSDIPEEGCIGPLGATHTAPTEPTA